MSRRLLRSASFMLLAAVCFVGTVWAGEGLSFLQQGSKVIVGGGHLELTFDKAHGGEVTGLRLHDGSHSRRGAFPPPPKARRHPGA
jgi:hypothetical protein